MLIQMRQIKTTLNEQKIKKFRKKTNFSLKNDATLFLTIIFHCCYLPCNMPVMSHCFENKIEIHMFNMPKEKEECFY
jgi:hypothetical protein